MVVLKARRACDDTPVHEVKTGKVTLSGLSQVIINEWAPNQRNVCVCW